MLSGSASKGYSKHYNYYHCFSKYGVRYNPGKVNKLFVEEFKKYNVDCIIQKHPRNLFGGRFGREKKINQFDLSPKTHFDGTQHRTVRMNEAVRFPV
ncbi:hypothetical protein [Pedobacter jamesrossensis]|uniref:Uncharacterized protein n=1 Tax=Pedobacter jamesrossensis TaxID=1908238 RepID=A0ABV8NS46_9SPHI